MKTQQAIQYDIQSIQKLYTSSETVKGSITIQNSPDNVTMIIDYESDSDDNKYILQIT